MKKRLFAAFVCLCMIVSLLPTMAFAEAGVQDSGIVTSASGLCEHHTQHDESCGYTEGTAEIPCSHEHTEDCYTLVTKCVHTHTEDCYPADDTATPSDAEEKEPVCGHVCSEESGCITKALDCKHEHDETCGYVPATEGTPCTFVCEVCNAQDSGNPATPSDAQPEECTCETLCTDEEINADCPVCSAEGAELDKVCVGAALLLTAPTLRTGEIKLFIGGQLITENGCYENRNGTWTKVDGTEPANGQFYYNAATFTLTLNQAEITHDQTVNVAEGYTYDGSVIAFSQTADVSLKIVVSQGTSTITGNGGIRVDSKTGNASLSIKGPGSLDVEPKGSNSGITLCSSKNTNLDIVGADVTASSPAQYGVYLISSTDASSTSTITVNNGSLTTGGNGNVGIYYYWSGTSNAGTSSLTVSGNAVVDTRNSQIMAQNKETVVQVGAGSDGNGGIVFNGKSGTVYGDVTLQEDLEIGTDETLTIGKDASLTVPDEKTLTNNGTINVESGGKLEGTTTGNGTLKIAPTITTQPQDVEVKENETATFTVKVTGTEPLSYQWQQSTDKGSSWTNIASATSDTYTTGKTTMDMSGTQYRCVVKNSIDEVTSDVALLKVKHNLVKIEYKAPTCTVNGNEEYWTCDTCDKYFSDANGDTEIAKDSWIISAINHDWNDAVYTWGDDGRTCTATRTCKNDSAHTETSKATVTDAQTKAPTCTEKGETTYTATFEADWAVTQTKVIVDIPATGHSYGEPEWSWSEDGKTCTVTFTCEKDETHKETPVVKVTSAVKKPATCTETGVTTYTATVEFNGQTHTDTKDVADIPATGHSYDNGKCTVCGAIASDFKVIITAGANGSWQKGTKDGLTFTSNAAYKHFQKVQVDGKDLDASNYTVKEGSTIVTLKTEYLETLSVGKHTLAIVSETGTATTEFTIKAAAVTDDTQSPQTGDDSNIALWIAVLLAAGTALTGTAVYSRKRKYSK